MQASAFAAFWLNTLGFLPWLTGSEDPLSHHWHCTQIRNASLQKNGWFRQVQQSQSKRCETPGQKVCQQGQQDSKVLLMDSALSTRSKADMGALHGKALTY